MKRIIIFVLMFSVCLCSCGKKHNETSSGNPNNAPVADSKNEIKTGNNIVIDPRAEAEAAAKLLEGIELTPKGLKTYYEGKKIEEVVVLEQQLIKHESEIVRAFVFERTVRNYSENQKELKNFVAVLKAEKSPKVIEAGLKSLMNNLKVSADLYEFTKECAKSDDKVIRSSAALVLSNSNNKSVDGIFDEAIKLLNDSDNDVRKVVCKNLPRSGNEAVIPEIVKILGSSEQKELDIHGDCLDGLVSMWYNYPVFDSQSEAAYKATLDYLKTTPRTNNVPAWNGMGKLSYNADKKPDWKAGATYFKAEDLVAVMFEIAKDPEASFNARKSAIKSIAAMGAKTDLEALHAAIDEADIKAKNAVEDALEKSID